MLLQTKYYVIPWRILSKLGSWSSPYSHACTLTHDAHLMAQLCLHRGDRVDGKGWEGRNYLIYAWNTDLWLSLQFCFVFLRGPGSPPGLNLTTVFVCPGVERPCTMGSSHVELKSLLRNLGPGGLWAHDTTSLKLPFLFCKMERITCLSESLQGFKVTWKRLAATLLLSANLRPCPRHCCYNTRKTSRILTWFLLWDWVRSKWKTPNSYCNSENEWTYESLQDAHGALRRERTLKWHQPGRNEPTKDSRVKTKQNPNKQNSKSLRVTALSLEAFQMRHWGGRGGGSFSDRREQGAWPVIIRTYKTWCIFSEFTQQILQRIGPAMGLCVSVGGH